MPQAENKVKWCLNKAKKELELEELKLQNNLEKRKDNKTEHERLTKEIDTIKVQLEKVEIKNPIHAQKPVGL